MPQKNYIRCNPSFHHYERFDTVLVQIKDGIQPARLHLVFEAEAFEKAWRLARVTFFTAILPPSASDRAIGMTRYEEATAGEFILLDTVIRSCYMTPVFSHPRHFYLNDLVVGDTDLFLRLNSHYR